MIIDPPGTQLSHVTSPAKFVEVLDLICNIQVPYVFLKATEVGHIWIIGCLAPPKQFPECILAVTQLLSKYPWLHP